MLLDTLDASLLRNLLPGKEEKGKRGQRGVIRADDGKIRDETRFFIPPHLLTNF